jgi:hypothetical protein
MLVLLKAGCMAGKFNRAYTLKIETNDFLNWLSIEKPFTVEFDIRKSTLASSNSGNFVIYNLNESHRRSLFKDYYDTDTRDPITDQFRFRSVQFYGGYKTDKYEMLPRIFNGDLRSAYSFREGPDYRTELDCFEMSITRALGAIAKTLPAGATVAQAVLEIAKSLKNSGVKKAVIGSFLDQISQRKITLFGNPIDALQELVRNNFYFDGDTIFALNDNEVIPGEIVEINSDDGLLGTPKRSEGLIEFSMLFEPRIKIGQELILKSRTEPIYNGRYKVMGLNHRGTISESVCGDAITEVSLVMNQALKPVLTSISL